VSIDLLSISQMWLMQSFIEFVLFTHCELSVILYSIDMKKVRLQKRWMDTMLKQHFNPNAFKLAKIYKMKKQKSLERHSKLSDDIWKELNMDLAFDFK
jgi:hypothetical protein